MNNELGRMVKNVGAAAMKNHLRIRTFLRTVFCFALCLFNAAAASAQDVHFSQFWESAVLRNPALVGIFYEDFKATAQHRNQWSSISKPFRTTQLAVEGKWAVGREASDYLSVGLQGYSDKAGTIALKTTGVYAAINYNKSLQSNRGTYLSMGFTGGRVGRSLDVTKATFNNQYTGGNGENFYAVQQSHWDLGAGLSLNSSFDADGLYTYVVGLAAYHFTRPQRAFFTDTSGISLNTRWNAHAAFNATLNDEWSAIFYADLSLQGPYKQAVGGGLLRWSRSDNLNHRDFAIYAGCMYRGADAVIPTVKVDWKSQSFGVSYDINVSSLKDATQMRGGLELSAAFRGMWKAGYNDRRLCPRL